MPSPTYTILQTLHQSDETVIYRAMNDCDHQQVILKMLGPNPGSRVKFEQLQHEYAIIKTLDSPSIVKPIALINYQGALTLVMEDLGGQSLDHFMDGATDVEQFLPIAIDIAKAVADIHHQGIMHKNLKPDNLIFNENTGELKITDFGIASFLSRETASMSSLQHIEGSLPYMAPEQTGWMNRVIDQRSDLYSLGVIFYEMITGMLPFVVHDPLEWIHCHVARIPPSVQQINPEIPQPIAQIIAKLLAKSADDRYQTAHGLQRDLELCLEQWQVSRKIAPFPLGTRDLSDRFHPPQKLYGREAEVATLLQSFEHATETGSSELVLVSGYAGIGKSSLISELYKPVISKHGMFLAGKFDQFQQGIPYATFTRICAQLMRDILAGNEESIALWRKQLQAALGVNGQLIVNVIPSIELIIGQQPPAPVLPPIEAQNRFRAVFRHLISVFAQEQHPLVLFLDDLQWADAASLALLQELITHSDMRYLLVIGSYREDEVTEQHPLTTTLQKAREAGVHITMIALTPLTQHDIIAIIRDTLHCQSRKAAPLAKLMVEKTDGNPFFMLQFLTTLYDEHLIWFDLNTETWQWDMQHIRMKGLTNNVIDLMVAKIQRFPDATQNILRHLACLGSRIENTIIAMTLRENEQYADFQKALRTGLLLRNRDSYEFIHDRVQQAIYSLIPVAEIPQMHLAIAQTLFAKVPASRLDDYLFDITSHFNIGINLITDAKEQLQVAELNLAAGRKAKTATAYASAMTYAHAGLQVLPAAGWKTHHALTFDLHHVCAECTYLLGDFAETERLCATALTHASTNQEKVAIYLLIIDLYTTTGRFNDALVRGVEGLGPLGIDLSLNPTTEQIDAEYQQVWDLLAGRKIEDLIDLPAITDPNISMALDILGMIHPSSHFLGSPLYWQIPALMAGLSLRFGNAPASAMGYCALAAILGQRFDQYREGYRFGKLGCTLAERADSLTYRVKTYFLMGGVIDFFTQPIPSSLAYLEQCFQAALSTGDINFALYTILDQMILKFMQGVVLGEVVQESEKCLAFARKVGFEFLANAAVSLRSWIYSLQGHTGNLGMIDTGQISEEEFAGQMREQALHDFCYYNAYRLQVYYLAGDYAAASQALKDLPGLLEVVKGEIIALDYRFYAALTLIALGPHTHTTEQQQSLERFLQLYKLWADTCPATFLSRYSLLAAEIARNEGHELDAERLYEQAFRSAHENGLTQIEALAYERASHFYRARGFAVFADTYLRAARSCYLQWGADGKVRQLDQVYPQLRGQTPVTFATTITAYAEQFDMLSAVRASQAISKEIALDTLIYALLHVALEQSGAQHASLFLMQESELWIEARAWTNENGIQAEMLHTQLSELAAHVPQTVIQYVQRTHERLLMNNLAIDESPFLADKYFAETQPKSMVCLPILRQNELTGVIYLENAITPYVFSPDRLSMLELLASQIAISLQNAILYEQLKKWNATLEQRAAERTAQLESAHAKLQEMFAEQLEVHKQLQAAHDTLATLATTDPLTGLPNHRAIVQCLDQELERARRYRRPFAVLFCDIDHFKALNDSIGHAAGDVALKVFGEIAHATLRQSDTIGRWGGEEFLALLPETTDQAAEQAAERVRIAVNAHIFPVGVGLHLTCSIGVACYPKDGTDRERLVTEADHAMYAAKQLGRNQVRSASEQAVKAVKPESQSREATMLLGVVETLSAMVEARDHYTGEHAKSVGHLMMEVALALGCNREDAQLINLAGRLHDIGKVAIPDAILQKPGKLTEDEWAIMRTHPIVGAEILSHCPSLQALASIVRAHHERWDGKGYPDGLARKTIPLGGRIAAVADAYNAMVTDRPYRPAQSSEEAIAELRHCAGSQFDPQVVDIFVQVITGQQRTEQVA